MAHKLITETERKYYKYKITSSTIYSPNTGTPTEANPYYYPFLTNFSLFGNNEGLGIRASSYYSTNYPWHIFDGNSNTSWVSNTGYPTWIAWSTPHFSRLTSINITPKNQNYPKTGTIDYSDNGEDWTTIKSWSYSGNGTQSFSLSCNSENTDYHKYYRLNILTGVSTTSITIVEIKIYGYFRLVNEGTSSNYSFYEDITNYKSPIVNNNYKSIIIT